MSLFSFNRRVHHARTRHQLRPRLDALEDRSLLTAGALDPTFGNGGIVLTSFPPLLKGFHGTGGNGFARPDPVGWEDRRGWVRELA